MIRGQWKEVSLEYCYYKPLWALHQVSPIFCQISEHLQYSLLTKLLGQFTEVHKSQFFQRLETLIRVCIALFFLEHFELIWG